MRRSVLHARVDSDAQRHARRTLKLDFDALHDARQHAVLHQLKHIVAKA